MSMFSGAVKLADLDDYLAPSQACIKPMMKAGESKQADNKKTTNAQTKDKNDKSNSVTLELDEDQNDDFSVAVNANRKTKASKNEGIKLQLENEVDDFFSVPSSSSSSVSSNPSTAKTADPHFSQIRETNNSTAKITLNDCLACSGCVTSAETVLITQQSTEEFLKMLQQNKQVAHEAEKLVFVVTVSPQARASLAHEFQLSLFDTQAKLTTFFQNIGCALVLDTTAALDVALLEQRAEFLERFQMHQKQPTASSSSSPSASSSSSSLPLPLLSSECPGWVCYAEKTQGTEILPYISKIKSPQAITGTWVKNYWSRVLNKKKRYIYHTTIMPCYDKKLEGARDDFSLYEKEEESKQTTEDENGIKVRETDCVLTSMEVVDLIKQHCDNFQELANSVIDARYVSVSTQTPTTLLTPYFTGSSGGYAENLFRYVAATLYNVHLPADQPIPESFWKAGKNNDWKELLLTEDDVAKYTAASSDVDATLSTASTSATIPAKPKSKVLLRFLLAYGFRNIQNLMRTIKKGNTSTASSLVIRRDREETNYHYVEIMACPSGCLNGGGQIRAKQTGIKAQKELISALEQLSTPSLTAATTSQLHLEQPVHNSIVHDMYTSWLGLSQIQPGSEPSKQYFYTQYHAVEKFDANPLAIKW